MADNTEFEALAGNSADDISSVFDLDGMDDPFIPPTASSTPEAPATPTPSPAPTPVAPVEPGAGVVAPSPAPATPSSNVAPTPAPTALPGLAPTAPAAPAQGATPQQAPGTTPAPAAPVAAPTPEQLELASLRQQLAHFQQVAGQQQPQGAPAPAQQPSGQPEAQQAPAYNLTIPDQLRDAIFNENPQVAQQGMTHLVNSLAQHVHQQMRTEMDGRFTALDARQQQERSQVSQQEQATRMQTEYYGAFPAHNTPLMKTIVAQQAQELQAAYPGLSWGPDFMNALGARVNQAVAALTGQPQAQTPAAPSTPAAPAPFAPQAPRAMVPVAGDDQFNVMDSTMQGMFDG